MKKLTAILLAALLVFSFAACGQNGGPGKTGEVSVFYYTFSDTYISSVRTAMDSYLKANNIEFNNYDANGRVCSIQPCCHSGAVLRPRRWSAPAAGG